MSEKAYWRFYICSDNPLNIREKSSWSPTESKIFSLTLGKLRHQKFYNANIYKLLKQESKHSQGCLFLAYDVIFVILEWSQFIITTTE